MDTLKSLLALIFYLLYSFGIYYVCKNEDEKNAWIAFLPTFSLLLILRSAFGKKKGNKIFGFTLGFGLLLDQKLKS